MLMMLVPFAAFGAGKIADVVYVKGTVQIVRDGKSMAAQLQAPIMQDDTITTKANGMVKILFKDDSVITISPDSSFSISEFLYNTQKQRSQSLFKLLYGKVRTVVGRTLLKITSDTAIAGVRGTVFDVWYDSATKTTYVAVLEGSVELKNLRPDVKGTQIITGGNASSVTGGEPPKPPTPYTPPPEQPGGNLPPVEPPAGGQGAPIGGQVITNTPPIHQTPNGFSKVGINVVFP